MKDGPGMDQSIGKGNFSLAEKKERSEKRSGSEEKTEWEPSLSLRFPFRFCTRGGNRTHTLSDTSLSRARLPIPPPGH
jgi:hypothetical protein